MWATKSDLRAIEDEIKVVEDNRTEAKKVATMEKDQNSLLLTELEHVKIELAHYKAGEEEC